MTAPRKTALTISLAAPGDSRISSSGFSGETLVANHPGGNVSSLGSGPFWQIL
ncbi:hypothetical protein [Rhizobium sp. AG207R]|uniref:hypothetical protein n=1 Tax=Rhizobium sp. AG207R TaxID=2802287 RepID=UPI0022AC0BE1|nr:hypothetical protein [Rhizobium sp. AG207R]